MAVRIPITADYLRSRLTYDQSTGKFFWLPRTDGRRGAEIFNSMFAGTEAGTISDQGYVIIEIDGRPMRAHRLAWLYVHGEWPNGHLDHRDRNRSNNKFQNLRPATRSQNQSNRALTKASTSKRKGVYWHAGARKWMAQIIAEGRTHYLGLFDDPDEASRAYQDAASRLFGEFASHNN